MTNKNTDMTYPPIALGCASIGNLGKTVSDENSEELLQYAWSQGIRYFDTAPHYGRGLSEQRLGKFLRTRPRDEYIISTKVGRLLSPGASLSEADGYFEPLPNDVRYDYSGDGIEQAFEQSCERLGTANIDILYIHDIGEYTHGESANKGHLDNLYNTGLERLNTLKSKGRIKAYGLGVNENQVCLDILQHHSLDVILLAGRLTLLDRSAEESLVQRCQITGTKLVLGGVFNSGILALGPVEGATFDYAPASPAVMAKAAQLQKTAESHGVTLAAAALHYAANHPAVCTVLIGTGKKSSLQRNLNLLETALPPRVEEMFT